MSLKFVCMRCNDCCYFEKPEEMPILLPYEVEYLKLLSSRLGVRLKFERLQSGFYKWIINGYCPFYSQEKRGCLIHGEKPLACRMYPLLVNLSDKTLLLSAKCRWVRENADKVSIIAEGLAQDVFLHELKAVEELFEALYYTSRGLIVLAFEAGDNRVLNHLVEECAVVKTYQSNLVKNLYFALLVDCSVEKALELIEKSGGKVVYYAEIREELFSQLLE